MSLFALIGDDITYQTAMKYVGLACGNLLISAILFHCKQITVFHISSEEHQDIDVAILRALLKGWYTDSLLNLVPLPSTFSWRIKLTQC